MKHLRVIPVFGVFAVFISAAFPGANGQQADADGPEVRRVITLAPHLTELVFSAGGGDRIVGVVEYSDYPPAARSLPRIGDAFRLDLERVVAADPDLILAWKTGNPERVIEQLVEMGFRVVSVQTDRLEDIPRQLEMIGSLLGTTETATEKAEWFSQSLDAVRERYNDAEPIRVFYQITSRPLYTVNGAHTISQLLDICGGTNIFANLDTLAPAVGPEAVIAGDPEVILGSDTAGLDIWRVYNDLAAIRSQSLYTIDADLVTRPGTRIIDGATSVCDALDRGRAARAAIGDE